MATATNLPASFVSGAILTADQMNNLRGAFRVLQVVAGSTSTQVVSDTTTPVDTGLTATITPQSTSNKILVCISQNGLLKITGNTSMALSVFRGGTNIGTILGQGGQTQNTDTNGFGGVSSMILDSPATTSATTYKTSFYSVANIPTVAVQHTNIVSTIVLMEISA